MAAQLGQLFDGIMQAYEPRDRTYLSGSSRGALMVRQLAGLILKAQRCLMVS
ncbi:phospholipase effector Tle1 domain-containing protein [Pseudomonadota bacterium]